MPSPASVAPVDPARTELAIAAVQLNLDSTREAPEQERGGAKAGNWWLLAVTAFIIGLTGIVAVILVRTVGNSSWYLYGVVIDGGSSSSKVAVYKWLSPFYGNGKVSEVSLTRVDLGLDKPGGVSQMYNAVTKAGKIDIPNRELSRSEVFLGATAGLRILQDKDPNATAKIFADVRQQLQATGLLFAKPNEQARILSGAEEGVDGWITVNYLLDALDPAVSTTNKPYEATFGSLDLGGASTQIAFATSTQVASGAPNGSVTNVMLYGEKYAVYGHSFLCYGKAQAQTRLLALLVKKKNFTSSVENPCAPLGTSVVKSAAEIFLVPCTRGPLARDSYDFDVNIPPSVDDNTKFTFVGKSQPAKCQQLVSELFNRSVCASSHCSFNNVYQPTLNSKNMFYAYSGFFFTMNFFNLTEDKSLKRLQANRQKSEEAVTAFCQLSWDQMQQIPVMKRDYLLTYCFDGNYVLQLLLTYGFKDNHMWSNIRFVEKVADTSIGWGLGYMITATGKIPQRKSLVSIELPPFILLLMIFTVLVMLGVFFAILALKRRRSQQDTNVAVGDFPSSYGTL